MKITQTSIVFAKQIDPNAPIDINNSFGAQLTLEVVLDEIVAVVESKTSSLGRWSITRERLEGPVIASYRFKNGFSILGDPTKAQIMYDGDLKFNANNPMPVVGHALVELLAKNKAIINSIGLNISGACETSDGRKRLKALINSSPIFDGAEFEYPAFILTYKLGSQSDPVVTLRLALDEKDDDIFYNANFNHDLINPANKAEWLAFVNRCDSFVKHLATILDKLAV